MYKIAVLGDPESVLGFRVLGLDVFPAETVDEAKRTLRHLTQKNYAIVYLTEQFAQFMAEDLTRYQDEITPAVILIPGREGALGIGMETAKQAVERAAGVNIL